MDARCTGEVVTRYHSTAASRGLPAAACAGGFPRHIGTEDRIPLRVPRSTGRLEGPVQVADLQLDLSDDVIDLREAAAERLAPRERFAEELTSLSRVPVLERAPAICTMISAAGRSWRPRQ